MDCMEPIGQEDHLDSVSNASTAIKHVSLKFDALQDAANLGERQKNALTIDRKNTACFHT